MYVGGCAPGKVHGSTVADCPGKQAQMETGWSRLLRGVISIYEMLYNEDPERAAERVGPSSESSHHRGHG